MKKNYFLVCVLSLLLSACSNAAGLANLIQAPRVSVQDVLLQDVSMTQGTALLRLNVTNPNPVAIPLRGVEYALRLNGRTVANGEQAQSLTLRPNQPVALDIPVRVGFQELIGLLPGVVGLGSVNYDLQGAVSLPMLKVPFSRSGTVGMNR